MKSYWKVINQKQIVIPQNMRKNKNIKELRPNELFLDSERIKWIHPDFHKFLKKIPVAHTTFINGARFEKK